jgi:hypothetical protein
MPSIGATGWPGYAAYRPNKMEVYRRISSCYHRVVCDYLEKHVNSFLIPNLSKRYLANIWRQENGKLALRY